MLIKQIYGIFIGETKLWPHKTIRIINFDNNLQFVTFPDVSYALKSCGRVSLAEKNMKTSNRTLLLALPAIMIAIHGCDPIENGPSRSDTEMTTIEEDLGAAPAGKHLYVSGVSFPEGYDWRRDTAYGKVPCNIFLMRDGEIICRVAAGEEGHAETAPDRHHIIGGHLYTEHSDGLQTVIQRDGKEILRYKGDETIRGMLVRNGKILTLGQNRYSRGFALRSNGKIICSSGDGELLGSWSDKAYARSGALYDDNGTPCFSYFTEKDGKRTWHFVDGDEDIVLNSEGIAAVYDMRTMWKDHYAVAKMSDGRAPVVISSGGPSDLSRSLAAAASNDYRLSAWEDRIFIVGEYRSFGSTSGMTGFWDEDGLITRISNDCRSFRYMEGRLDYLKTSSGKVLSATFGGRTSPIQGDWCIMTPQCLCWTGDGPILALSDTGGKKSPAIWKDGVFDELDLNGFLTAVTTGN